MVRIIEFRAFDLTENLIDARWTRKFYAENGTWTWLIIEEIDSICPLSLLRVESVCVDTRN